MLDRIREHALALMDGTQNDGEDALLYDVCIAVRNALTMKLREGVRAEEISENFIAAAALLSADLMLQLRRGGISKFDAGTLTMTFDTSPMSALAHTLVAPWLGGAVCVRSVIA